ncbi:hypothetical protein VNO78_18322 [Psophocarpus tetragonolobus]|uniref:Pectinesterase inhibitor domain-containing protein n=1 Tax=Psophocarpus tetragonolobus TaxID=3891 RepID=A0AAN9XLR1_PSOTE
MPVIDNWILDLPQFLPPCAIWTIFFCLGIGVGSKCPLLTTEVGIPATLEMQRGICFCPFPHQVLHGYFGTMIELIRGRSMSSSKEFVSLVSKYLKSPSNFSNSTILALQDCHLLGDLNNAFWHKTLKKINFTNTLSSSEAEKFHTLLSATLTNYDTCLNSLRETTASPDDVLLTYLSNGTKCYSVSLAIFKRGWVDSANKERKLTETDYQRWERKVYELIRMRGRKLLELVPDNVVVSQRVVVKPDGSGNYTSINDAVAAAPNNTGWQRVFPDSRCGWSV